MDVCMVITQAWLIIDVFMPYLRRISIMKAYKLNICVWLWGCDNNEKEKGITHIHTQTHTHTGLFVVCRYDVSHGPFFHNGP